MANSFIKLHESVIYVIILVSLEGTNKTLCALRSRERSSGPKKRLSQICLCVVEGFLRMHESAAICHSDRVSTSSSPGR